MLTALLLSFGLALDALSVSIAEGAACFERKIKLAAKLALTFGFFQGGMSLLGVLINGLLASYVDHFDHWIAFGIFVLLGAKMIKEGLENEEKTRRNLSFGVLMLLGLATSIDAAAAGMTLPLLDTAVSLSVFLIGTTTFVLCFFGAQLGGLIQAKFKKLPLEVLGGVLLILLGIKALF